MGNYYSQEGQDSILLQFFNKVGIDKGYFVDVGSVDGIHFSNTYALEQSGWNGICVEAHPTYYPMLKENRTNSHCYGVAAGNEDKNECVFHANYRSSLSTLDPNMGKHFAQSYVGYYGDRDKSEIDGAVNGEIQIPMMKLDTILENHNSEFDSIDVMTIDVDGSEPYTFAGLDLNKWKPRIFIVEHTVVGNVVREYASKHGYTQAKMCGADIIYCRDSQDASIIAGIAPQGTPMSRPHPVDLVNK
jgi:FkbM family methyltransferase